jgi:hypothetical protein
MPQCEDTKHEETVVIFVAIYFKGFRWHSAMILVELMKDGDMGHVLVS